MSVIRVAFAERGDPAGEEVAMASWMPDADDFFPSFFFFFFLFIQRASISESSRKRGAGTGKTASFLTALEERTLSRIRSPKKLDASAGDRTGFFFRLQQHVVDATGASM